MTGQRCRNGYKGHFRANCLVLFLFENSCYGVVAEAYSLKQGLRLKIGLMVGAGYGGKSDVTKKNTLPSLPRDIIVIFRTHRILSEREYAQLLVYQTHSVSFYGRKSLKGPFIYTSLFSTKEKSSGFEKAP